jgi:uncharacterized protein
VRSPGEFSTSFHFRPSRRRATFLIAGVVLLVLITSLQRLATLWTDGLWFSSLGQGGVYGTLLAVKVGLVAVFGGLFFFVLWINLWYTSRVAPTDLSFDPADEVARRFQNVVRPRAGRIFGVLSVAVGGLAGLSALGQWQSYLLFSHAQSFHQRDPLFHKDLGFYVFRLPFWSYVVNFVLSMLFVTLTLSVIFHFLSGGARVIAGRLRVSGAAKMHLSILGALVAIVKAVGYVLLRYELVVSSNGFVNGAGYADVHARMPAFSVLFWVSLAAAGLFLANVRLQRWSAPALAVGVWAVVSLLIGVVYPAALQRFRVTPSQASLEAPFIQRNITATLAAYDLTQVQRSSYAGTSTLTTSQIQKASSTLNNIRLWDPSSDIALANVSKTQTIRSYYTFTSLGVDRYLVNGRVTPVLIGARQLNTSNLSSPSWVNEHLQFTHGYGAAVLPANTFDSTTGNPTFVVSDVPPSSTAGLPVLTQPSVYFGINDPGWVVADSKQGEQDYTNADGSVVESHYRGGGGVALSSFWRRTAFAIRLGDVNLWISSQITPHSRMIFERDVQNMAAKMYPFLSFDAHPYAVLVNGHVNFVLDGYTTTSMYPYSQNALTQNVPTDSNLPASFNYVRNAVKVVVDAYTGQMTAYAMTTTDPLLNAYRSAFPTLVKPLADMPSAIRAHLRYPMDLFSIQAAIFGRYHISSASAFFSASDNWEVSPTVGEGSPSQSIQLTQTTDATGAIVASTNAPMDPLYQVMSLPNESRQQLTLSDSYIPAGNSSTVQSLSAFLEATSDPDNYGQLRVFVAPRGTAPVIGPVQADSLIQQNAKVSSAISLLDQHGSKVLLGNNLMVPLDNAILYIRPMYVSSTSNPLPELKYVIAVFNHTVGFEPTLQAALSDVLGGTPAGGGSGSTSGGGTTTGSGTVTSYLNQAAAAYQNAQAALAASNLGQYQADVTLMNHYLQLAQAALHH